MSLFPPRQATTDTLAPDSAADGGREAMWPEQGIARHLSVAAALLVLTLISTANTLTTRYVLKDRSGFTLDSRYIIELDPRSRSMQWRDRGDLQKELFIHTSRVVQADALFQETAPLAELSARAKEIADPAKYSEFGFVNYFTKDYWWPKGISGLYRPLTSITYWWNFALIREVPPAEWEKLNQENPEKYHQISAAALKRFHTTNTVLHWLAATLTYFLMLSLCGRFWVSAFAAAMFSVHPITVESVANIIGRADIFAGIFVFSTLLLYIRSTKVSGVHRIPWLAAAMLVLTVGVFCKESALAAGPLVAAYEVIYRYHPRIPGLFQSARRWFDDGTRWLGDFLAACLRFCFTGWVWLVPPVIAVFTVRYLVFAASTPPEEPFLDNPIRGHPLEGLNENRVLSFIEGRVTALKVAVLLLGKLVYPVNLSSDYSYNQIAIFDSSFKSLADVGAALAALLVLGALVLGFWLWYRGSRAAAYMIFFFFLAMLPTANLVKVIGSIMAERSMSLSLFGFVGGLSLVVFTAGERLLRVSPASPLRYAPHALLSVLLILYTARTFARNYAWRSDELLWEAAKKVSPRSFRSYQSYAFALYENAKIDLVRKEQAVLNLFSERDKANATLADSAATPEARRDAQLTLQFVEEHLPKAQKELLEQAEVYKKAVAKMIEVDEQGMTIVDHLPHIMNSARMYLHLGMYYAEMGRLTMTPGAQAMTPESTQWYQKSVDILGRAIPIDRAFNNLNRRKEITRGKPINDIPDAGLAPIYLMRGDSQLRLNRMEDAVESFRYVQQLDPMASVTYLQIGAIRLSQGRLEDALTNLIQAVILDPTRPEPWPMLQNVYQAMGAPDAILVNGDQRQINATSPLVQQHVRNAMRELIRTMLRGKNYDFARTLRKQAVDVHGTPEALINSLFTEAGVPIEPPPRTREKWR